MSREVLKLENEQRREFDRLERDMRHESPETGSDWYDDRFGQAAYELGVKHGRALLVCEIEQCFTPAPVPKQSNICPVCKCRCGITEFGLCGLCQDARNRERGEA